MAAKSISRNHIKIAKLHIFLALLDTALLGALMLYHPSVQLAGREISFAVPLAIPVSIHLSIAWGCWRKWKIARFLSALMGYRVFILVPIGTILTLVYFFPLLDWEPDTPNAPHEPWARPRAGNLAAS